MSESEGARKTPYVLQEEAGKKAWCACGKSANQPYCDGAHAGTGMAPVIVDIPEAGTVAWCGCRKSGKGAICDGSHAAL